jgi:peptidoglycan/LPS O-acetylase OafA/YrhL
VKTTTKLNALTSLRFVAAAMIVVHHLRGLFGVPRTIGEPVLLDQAVAFFFVLSGFILTYVYPSLDDIGVAGFLRARIARVWPAHLAGLLLVFLLLPAPARGVNGHYSLAELAANIGMVHAWIPSSRYYFSFNHVAWSISTEFGFYLCFPLLIHQWRRTWAVKLSLALVTAALMIVMANRHPTLADGLTYVNPLARVFEFTLGMTAALWWQVLRSRIRPSRSIGTLLELSAVAIVVVCMYFAGPWADSARVWVGDVGAAWLVHGGIVALPFAALISVMALEQGAVSHGLSRPFPVLLGEISYSVYLVHQLFIRYYWQHPRALSQAPGCVALVVFWLLVLLTAHLLFVLVERPARAFLSGKQSAGRRPSPLSAPGKHAIATSSRAGRWWLLAELALIASLVALVGYYAHFRPGTGFVGET